MSISSCNSSISVLLRTTQGALKQTLVSSSASSRISMPFSVIVYMPSFPTSQPRLTKASVETPLLRVYFSSLSPVIYSSVYIHPESTHAQLPRAQLYLVSINPGTARKTQSIGISGSTLIFSAIPLFEKLICIILSFLTTTFWVIQH